MTKLSKSRLLKSIPLLGFVFFLIVIVCLALLGFSPEKVGFFVSTPAFLLLLVALGFIRLQTAVLLQGVILGVWWQFGDEMYFLVVIGALVGLKLGEWLEGQWKSAIDRAKAEETPATLSVGNAGHIERPAANGPQQPTEGPATDRG